MNMLGHIQPILCTIPSSIITRHHKLMCNKNFGILGVDELYFRTW